MLKIGIIGLGPHWESHYRPALMRLSQRMRVAAVYDPVASRAERAAHELGAKSVLSMRALLKRPDVRAVLLLDESWHGLMPLRFAIDSGKPLYVTGRLSASLESLDALCRDAAGQSLVVCPELRLRTAPATARIMELTATGLGAVESADVRLNVAEPLAFLPMLVAVIDAAGVVVRSVPSAIETIECDATSMTLQVTFGRLASDGQPLSVRIIATQQAESPGISAMLTCRGGTILQLGETGLRWRRESGDELHEQLDVERTGAEVLLDHFARRIVGGLVPIPGLDDACRILRMLDPHRNAIASVLRRD
jgi:hypothetical protein